MRNSKLLISLCLLTLTAAAPAAAPTVDSNNDFDCATAYKYAYRMSVAKQLEPEIQEQTLLMNKWFTGNFDDDKLPGDKSQLVDHFSKVLDALVNDPKGAGEILKACSARAKADPAFEPFWILHRKDPLPR